MNSELQAGSGFQPLSGLQAMRTALLGSPVPDLSDVRIFPKKPWLLELWEPLRTKAPCPDKTQPYCCYVNTVIFYVLPWTVRPWHHFWICNGLRRSERPGTSYEKWDEIETRLKWDDVVSFGDELFEVGGGSVVWRNKRWWMKRWARRMPRVQEGVGTA